MQEFLAMGGYAVYVWSAYGLTAVVLGANAWFAKRRERSVLRDILAQAEKEQSRT